MTAFFCALSATGNFFQHFLLLALRLYFGWSFFQAGYHKWLALDQTASYLAQLHIPFPLINTYLVASIESIGGICLIAGFASRLASIPLTVVLLVALFTQHVKGAFLIFSNPNAFLAETPVPFLMATLVIFCFGPGSFSLDYLISRFCKKNESPKP